MDELCTTEEIIHVSTRVESVRRQAKQTAMSTRSLLSRISPPQTELRNAQIIALVST